MNREKPDDEEENGLKKATNASDYLANERTFLAWLRTSIGIMAFGFVVVKFALFMKQISIVLGKPLETNQKGYSSMLGIALVCIGILTVLFSYVRFMGTKKQLDNGAYESSSILITTLIFLILLMSILLVAYLLRSI